MSSRNLKTMDIQKVYISFDGDHIGRKVGQASLADSTDEIRRISQAIERGNEIWRSWAITVGGDVISLGGDEGRIAVNADHLVDLHTMRERYEQTVDATVSVGVGLKLSEADKALLVSKLEGGNRITFYTPEIEAKIQEIENKHQSEEDKIYDEYLDKAEHPLQGQFEGMIREAEDAEAAKTAQAEKSSSTGQAKAAVVQILQQVRANTKELEGLKDEAPHLYESIQAMVQALIMLGRQLQSPTPTAQPIQKSEDLAKTEKAKHFVMHYPVGFLLPPGAGNGGKGGRIKVAHSDGKTSWVSIRSGMVMGPDGAPASSRNPSGGSGGE